MSRHGYRTASVTGQWQKQTALLSDLTFRSELEGIWTERVTKSDRRCQVTDGELMRVKGRRKLDCFGNMKHDPASQARIKVERHILTLPINQQRAITPRSKWTAVELAQTNHWGEALLVLSGQ